MNFTKAASLLLITASISSAQINTEFLHRMKDTTQWTKTISVSADYQSGNTQDLTLLNEFRTDYNIPSRYILFSGSLKYKEYNNTVQTTDNGYLHFRYQEFLSDWINPEIYAQYNYDHSLLLKSRYLAGGGARFGIVDGSSKTLDDNPIAIFAGIGAFYEVESYDHASIKDEKLIRQFTYFSGHWKIDKRLSLTNVTYMQTAFSNFSDMRILEEMQFNFLLIGNLDYFFELSYRHDNSPAGTVKHSDFEMTNGLSISF